MCAVCHGLGAGRICLTCIDHFAQGTVRCDGCALPLPTAVQHCAACDASPRPFTRAIAACDYAFPWNGLMQAFKSQRQLDLAPAWAALLDRAVRSSEAHGNLLLPVPASTRRLRERGFNPAWEIGRRLARLRSMPAYATVLQRVCDTPTQRGLTQTERIANVRGVFTVPTRHVDRVRGRHVVLVDDVMTTGATASEATHTLLNAGAASVQVWVLARTPNPDH